MKRKNKFLNKIKVVTTSQIRFINDCINNNIILENIERTTSKEMFCDVSDNNLKKVLTLNNTDYIIEIIQKGGKNKLLNNVIYRIGLIIGVAISFVGIMLCNNRLLQIHINGLISVEEGRVVDSLNSLGVTKFSKMNYNFEEIENYLIEEFNFSLVSIVTKGNSIIINIKESLPNLEDSYAPITADYNMVIKSIEVFSGTSLVNVGDIVYKGDILVQPFFRSGEDIVYVAPCANITAETFFSNSYVFYNEYEDYVRTGKKEIISCEISLGIFAIDKKDKVASFDTYELDNTICNVSNYFLPIIIEKIYCYETEKVLITRDFESEKDEIINSLKEALYSQFPLELEIESEKVDIIEIENGYIINNHISSVINLKYQ